MKYIILEKSEKERKKVNVGHVIICNDEEAEVTATGKDGVTARDEKGKKFQVLHDHVEVKGKGGGKKEEGPVKEEQKPRKGEPDLEVADDEEDKESVEEKAEKKPPKKKVTKKGKKEFKEKNANGKPKRGII
jgi:hypothetical protein